MKQRAGYLKKHSTESGVYYSICVNYRDKESGKVRTRRVYYLGKVTDTRAKQKLQDYKAGKLALADPTINVYETRLRGRREKRVRRVPLRYILRVLLDQLDGGYTIRFTDTLGREMELAKGVLASGEWMWGAVEEIYEEYIEGANEAFTQEVMEEARKIVEKKWGMNEPWKEGLD